jgi:endogenous inhibitor of DNA gyrase (YacG/DUF329 family)
MASCPICKKNADPSPSNPHRPFCSVRCRQVDLGRWLAEDYVVPEPLPPAAHDDDPYEPR